MATPALRIRIAPKFPTKQQAGVGLGVSRTGGIVTYRQDWSNVQEPVGALPDVEMLVQDEDGALYRTTPDGVADQIRPVASQPEAEAGSNNTKTMTPLRSKQQIDARLAVEATPDADDNKLTTPIDLMRRSRPAIANMRLRALSDRFGDSVSVLDFEGIQIDGTSDSTLALERACSHINGTSDVVKLPAMTFMTECDALSIGNGTVSAVSTRFGGGFRGQTATAYGTFGTRIVARNPGGTLLTVAGVTTGVEISGVTLDAAYKANNGLDIRSCSDSVFQNFEVLNFKTYGLLLRTLAPDATTGWSSGNVFGRFKIAAYDATQMNDYGAGLLLDGEISKNYDPHRNTFIGGIVQLQRRSGANPNYGATLAFCDSNTFIECDIGVMGTGTGSALLLTDVSNPGIPYPQNNFFYGSSLLGGIVTSGTIGDHFFVNFPTKDGETIPDHPNLRGFTDTGEFFGVMKLPITEADFKIKKGIPAFVLELASGLRGIRWLKNASDAADFGALFQTTNDSGATWRTDIKVTPAGETLLRFPTYADNAAAVAGGLEVGQFYYNGTSIVPRT